MKATPMIEVLAALALSHARPRKLFTGFVETLLIALVRGYQFALSPFLTLIFGTACRFQPSCSEYFILAVRKHGPLQGAAKGVWRVCRCHPWNRGGYDPP